VAERYLAALVDGDRLRAGDAIGDGLSAGLDAPTLVLEVLAPAQRELGCLWQERELTVAQEHHGTEITREELERVRRARRPARSLDASALVCAAPGERHTLPARCFAALLDCAGWEVDFLGEAPPVEDVVGFVAWRRPRLVALSATLSEHLPPLAALCRTLRGSGAGSTLLVGGAAVAGRTAESLGADLLAVEAAPGLAMAAGLLAAPTAPPDLPTYLDRVGRRIHAARRAAGISQSALAERAGLARPYLGAIERGRQNITLDSALRIAAALGLSTTELLA
jgi:methanogenic corrinoid protein MtbC1/DNA-binding XRE family transcriptional regulator